MNSQNKLLKVIENDFCIGCGVCASFPNSKVNIELNEYGMYKANLKKANNEELTKLSNVCPFANTKDNESTIGQELFKNDCNYDEKIGYYLNTFAGYVKEDEFRRKGSSGGVATWLLTELLNLGYIDGVVHVKTNKKDKDVLFKYAISKTSEEIREGTKSRYYPIEMSQTIKEVRNLQGKYAFVGIPCFIKAIRLLSKEDNLFSKKVGFTISLFCGHLKSKNYLDYLIRKMGMEPKNVIYADFRKKVEGKPASDYALEVVEEKGGEQIIHTKMMKELVSDPWGTGLFKYNACDYCDDVAGETADVTLGDAWLPEYVKDSGGTNIIIIRNKKILEVFQKAHEENRIYLENLTPKDIISSQIGNFRHRQQELGYRLFLLEQKGKWYPEKRIKPSSKNISKKRCLIQEYRLKLAKTSHDAYLKAINQNNIQVFEDIINPLIKKYRKLYKKNFVIRAISRIKRELSSKGENN